MKVKELKEELNYYDDELEVFIDTEEFIAAVYEDEHPYVKGEKAVYLET